MKKHMNVNVFHVYRWSGVQRHKNKHMLMHVLFELEVTCESVFFFINTLKQKEQSLFHLSNVTPKGRAEDKVIYGGTV